MKRAIVWFAVGVAVALAGSALSAQISSSVTVSCNSDGTLNLNFVRKP